MKGMFLFFFSFWYQSKDETIRTRIKREEIGAFGKIKSGCIKVFCINTKIKLSEHSKKMDVSEYFSKNIKIKVKTDVSK